LKTKVRKKNPNYDKVVEDSKGRSKKKKAPTTRGEKKKEEKRETQTRVRRWSFKKVGKRAGWTR